MSQRGRFITLEGSEGAGKGTVLGALREQLAAQGHDVLVTREPRRYARRRGHPHGAARCPVQGLAAETELLLMFALARRAGAPYRPSARWRRDAGSCPTASPTPATPTRGGGRGQPLERIAELERWAADGLVPDLTLLLDLPVQGPGAPAVAARRIASKWKVREFFERVRAAYRARAASEPRRFRVIDASRLLHAVLAEVRSVLDAWLGGVGSAA